MRSPEPSPPDGTRGMVALVETWESSIGERFPKPGRSWMLANDPISLDSLLR